MSILDGKEHTVKIKIHVSDTIPKLVILDKDRTSLGIVSET